MDKLYKNQSKLRITLRFNQDVSSSTLRKIKYIKPDGTAGEWNASLSGTTDIYYDLSVVNVDKSQLDQAGKWVFWGFVTFADGRSAPSESVEEFVYNEGE